MTLFANGTYDRSFELINAFDVVLESTTVLVEDGTFVLELDWDIQPGQATGCAAYPRTLSSGVKAQALI